MGGLLTDPCPLCEPEGETAGDERPELSSAIVASDGSTHDAPLSEIEQADSVGATETLEQLGKEEDSRSGAEDTSCPDDSITGTQGVPKAATAMTMTAPPGIGPPGVWVWPHPDGQPCHSETPAVQADCEEEQEVSWPDDPVNSVEVEFIGKVAQLCFGSDF